MPLHFTAWFSSSVWFTGIDQHLEGSGGALWRGLESLGERQDDLFDVVVDRVVGEVHNRHVRVGVDSSQVEETYSAAFSAATFPKTAALVSPVPPG